jgi:hypothetical protein
MISRWNLKSREGATEMGSTTEELANAVKVQPQSLRARVCRTGSYFGLRPHKLPNGRLIWPPVDEAMAFLRKQGDKSEAAA